LIVVADTLTAKRDGATLEQLERARAALVKAQQLVSTGGGDKTAWDRFEVHWRQARVCQLMTAKVAGKEQRMALAHEGMSHARRALALFPKRVEPHYYLALNMGRLAEADRRLSLIKPMVASAKRALAIDPVYDRAGAWVFLGKVLLTAPAWPVSVGDTEKALLALKQAVRIAPRNALARLFLAQALAAEEEYAEAKVQLERVRTLPLSARWRDEADKVLREVDRALGHSAAAAPAAHGTP
jgi:tetratricopeptide (TPR) repeat protein